MGGGQKASDRRGAAAGSQAAADDQAKADSQAAADGQVKADNRAAAGDQAKAGSQAATGEQVRTNAAIAQLREALDGARSAVFFGGAGVSTESGIPDFRSTNGIYRTESGLGYPPETIISHSFATAHPRDFWRFYRDKMLFPDAQPNACHKKLAQLEAAGHLAAVVTQNIDGLHQAAGSKRVLELHGSVHRNHCLSCGRRYTLAEVMALCDAACGGSEGDAATGGGAEGDAVASGDVKDDKVTGDGVPRCPACGGLVRPDVVLYEEALDEAVMREAMAVIDAADVLVVAGTSLAVWPAAGFISYFHGRTLAVVNMSPTSADADADLVIHAPVGQVFA